VLIAIGRSGDFRRLGVPGETLDKVFNRLHDPADFRDRRCLVVGGGDSALETAIALASGGGDVTLVHRGAAFARPKPEYLEALESLLGEPAPAGRLAVRFATRVREIREREVALEGPAGGIETLANDVVFTMIGREPPLDFLRRTGVRIAGEMTPSRWTAMGLFLLFCG
jgi:thioredoxin reductase